MADPCRPRRRRLRGPPDLRGALAVGGEWKISYDLADPAHRARYLSAFQLGSGAQQAAGPLLVTTLVLPHAWGWAALAGLTLSAGIAFQPLIAGAEVPASPAVRGEVL
jgi:MFS family permease